MDDEQLRHYCEIDVEKHRETIMNKEREIVSNLREIFKQLDTLITLSYVSTNLLAETRKTCADIIYLVDKKIKMGGYNIF